MSSSINRSSNASKASNDFDRRASSASASASSASGGGGRAHASASATYVDPENVAKLEAITGLSRAHAMNLLEAANNKLDKAIDLHFNQPSTNKPTSSSNSKSSSSSSSSSHQTTSKKASSSSSSSSSSATNGNNKRAISDDDSSNGSCVATGDEDNVRAPIPQKIDRLLDYDPYALSASRNQQSKRMRGAFDGFQSAQVEATNGDQCNGRSSKKQALSIMYQPPVDLIFQGSFEASKVRGCEKNKWILLNVQNQTDFQCQLLNRDVWKDDIVKEIVRANFIFVQIYFDSAEGQKLINYYRITTYPFIGVIDPRTGENLLLLNPLKLDQMIFCEKITSFLCDHDAPSPEIVQDDDDDENSKKSVDVIRVDEDDEDDAIVVIGNKMASSASSLSSKSEQDAKKFKAGDLLKDVFNEQEEEQEEVDDNSDADVCVADSDDSDDCVTRKEDYGKKHQQQQQQKPPPPQQKQDAPMQSNNTAATTSTSATCTTTTTATTAPTQQPVQPTQPEEKYVEKHINYETSDALTKDCKIRILCPNGDRIDFSTNGDNKLKLLIDYLNTYGSCKASHELIERLRPTTVAQKESRNLFDFDMSQTFKQLGLFPRIFLILQPLN